MAAFAAAPPDDGGRRPRGPNDVDQQQQQQQQQQQPPGLLESVMRWFVIMSVAQMFMKWGQNAIAPHINQEPKTTQPSSSVDGSTVVVGEEGGTTEKMKPLGASSSTSQQQHRSRGSRVKPTCIWIEQTPISLSVYITESSTFTPNKQNASYPTLVEWHQTDLILNSFEPENDRNETVVIPVGERLWNNESMLYAHVELRRRVVVLPAQRQRSEDKKEEKEDDVLKKVIPLTRHRVRKRIRDEKNLLQSAKSQSKDGINNPTTTSKPPPDSTPLTLASLNTTHDQTLLYLKPTLTLQLVDISIPFPEKRQIPETFGQHMDWIDDMNYYPILYSSEFWITKDSLMEINGTVTEGRVEIRFENVKMWKWQLMSGMEQNWKTQEQYTGEDDSASDVFRTMLLETNPYLLAITGIVSILHTIFDFLAFKNDISFFRGTNKSMEGFSVRSMIVNTWFQLVILLYLADNETSFMVLISNGIGLVIEIWKITKAITITFQNGKLSWREVSSYTKSRTKEYDEIATSHLLFVTMPLVTGYGMYSLAHQTHKGWYSWILSTLVGFIYMFGFVLMTPQLFINYKLQSVAHLNWRTMTYKSVNTFIDDLFAFVIKMPIMHRLACFRDDIIFLIFCYQRYQYRTDYSRVNEYGQCSEPTEEMIREREKEEEANNGAGVAKKGTKKKLLADDDAPNLDDGTTSTTTTMGSSAVSQQHQKPPHQPTPASTTSSIQGKEVRQRRGARDKR